MGALRVMTRITLWYRFGSRYRYFQSLSSDIDHRILTTSVMGAIMHVPLWVLILETYMDGCLACDDKNHTLDQS